MRHVGAQLDQLEHVLREEEVAMEEAEVVAVEVVTVQVVVVVVVAGLRASMTGGA